MGFSFWHWVIVTAIAAIVFWRQIPSVILHVTDPSLALRYRLGLLGAKDREAMMRKRERIRLELRQKAWFFVVAVLALIYIFKALNSQSQASADICATPTGNYEVALAAIGSSCIGPTGASGLIVRSAEATR